MFDRDLQEIIHAENRDFIAQAMERARAAKEKKPKEIILSKFEGVLANAVLDDLSGEALEEYRARVRIEDAVGATVFNRLLLQQGFLKEEHGTLTPTGFGFLLFGKKPRRVIHQLPTRNAIASDVPYAWIFSTPHSNNTGCTCVDLPIAGISTHRRGR